MGAPAGNSRWWAYEEMGADGGGDALAEGTRDKWRGPIKPRIENPPTTAIRTRQRQNNHQIAAVLQPGPSIVHSRRQCHQFQRCTASPWPSPSPLPSIPAQAARFLLSDDGTFARRV